ncbi:hypothetical protein [Kaarinaea lacus]
MKKIVSVSIVVATIAGYGFWQLHISSQGGAGETQLASRQTPTTDITPVNKEGVSTKPLSVAIASDDRTVVEVATSTINQSEATLSSDTPTEDDANTALEKFVGSGRPEAIMQFYAQRRRARAQLVQAKMNSEYDDPQWSSELTQRFEFARQLMPGLKSMSLTQTDCRESICALHLEYGGTAYKKVAPFMQHIGTMLGSDAWVHHDAMPDGPVVYVARNDTQLPDVETP